MLARLRPGVHSPLWGCRGALSAHLGGDARGGAFGIEIDKDVVRRASSLDRIGPTPYDGSGPSWLTFLGHAKDSLWSVDLFRCESVMLRTYWVLVVLDQYTRSIVGFAIQRGAVDGHSACRMFNAATSGRPRPRRLGDHRRKTHCGGLVQLPAAA